MMIQRYVVRYDILGNWVAFAMNVHSKSYPSRKTTGKTEPIPIFQLKIRGTSREKVGKHGEILIVDVTVCQCLPCEKRRLK